MTFAMKSSLYCRSFSNRRCFNSLYRCLTASIFPTVQILCNRPPKCQGFDGSPFPIWGRVQIPHGHRNICVSHQRHDRYHVNPIGRNRRSKRMSQKVEVKTLFNL